MIDAKELAQIGAKVAENPEEAFWSGMKSQGERAIVSAEREIEINKYLLKLVAEKLKLFRKV